MFTRQPSSTGGAAAARNRAAAAAAAVAPVGYTDHLAALEGYAPVIKRPSKAPGGAGLLNEKAEHTAVKRSALITKAEKRPFLGPTTNWPLGSRWMNVGSAQPNEGTWRKGANDKVVVALFKKKKTVSFTPLERGQLNMTGISQGDYVNVLMPNEPLNVSHFELVEINQGAWRWRAGFGPGRSRTGRQLNSNSIAEALLTKARNNRELTFNAEEWASLNVEEFKNGDFIQVEDDYFKLTSLSPLPFQWLKVGTSIPKEGRSFDNQALRDVLDQKDRKKSEIGGILTFTFSEWNGLNITNLNNKEYVQIDNAFFQVQTPSGEERMAYAAALAQEAREKEANEEAFRNAAGYEETVPLLRGAPGVPGQLRDYATCIVEPRFTREKRYDMFGDQWVWGPKRPDGSRDELQRGIDNTPDKPYGGLQRNQVFYEPYIRGERAFNQSILSAKVETAYTTWWSQEPEMKAWMTYTLVKYRQETLSLENALKMVDAAVARRANAERMYDQAREKQLENKLTEMLASANPTQAGQLRDAFQAQKVIRQREYWDEKAKRLLEQWNEGPPQESESTAGANSQAPSAATAWWFQDNAMRSWVFGLYRNANLKLFSLEDQDNFVAARLKMCTEEFQNRVKFLQSTFKPSKPNMASVLSGFNSKIQEKILRETYGLEGPFEDIIDKATGLPKRSYFQGKSAKDGKTALTKNIQTYFTAGDYLGPPSDREGPAGMGPDPVRLQLQEELASHTPLINDLEDVFRELDDNDTHEGWMHSPFMHNPRAGADEAHYRPYPIQEGLVLLYDIHKRSKEEFESQQQGTTERWRQIMKPICEKIVANGNTLNALTEEEKKTYRDNAARVRRAEKEAPYYGFQFLQDLADLPENGLDAALLNSWQFELLEEHPLNSPQAASETQKAKIVIMAAILLEKLYYLYSLPVARNRFQAKFNSEYYEDGTKNEDYDITQSKWNNYEAQRARLARIHSALLPIIQVWYYNDLQTSDYINSGQRLDQQEGQKNDSGLIEWTVYPNVFIGRGKKKVEKPGLKRKYEYYYEKNSYATALRDFVQRVRGTRPRTLIVKRKNVFDWLWNDIPLEAAPPDFYDLRPDGTPRNKWAFKNPGFRPGVWNRTQEEIDAISGNSTDADKKNQAEAFFKIWLLNASGDPLLDDWQLDIYEEAFALNPEDDDVLLAQQEDEEDKALARAYRDNPEEEATAEQFNAYVRIQNRALATQRVRNRSGFGGGNPQEGNATGGAGEGAGEGAEEGNGDDYDDYDENNQDFEAIRTMQAI